MHRKKKSHKKQVLSPKIQEAQRMKGLKRKMWQIVKSAGAEEAYRLIPDSEQKLLFGFRMKPFDVNPNVGKIVDPENIKVLKRLSIQMFQHYKLQFSENGCEVSLYDYFYAGEQLRSYLRNTPEGRYPQVAKVQKGFAKFMNMTNVERVADNMAIKVGNIISKTVSDMTQGIFILKYDYAVEEKFPPVFYNRFVVDTIEAQSDKFLINGAYHTAYRVVWPITVESVIWAQIALDKLGLNKYIKNLKADVYIQKHALNRLKERLDCIDSKLINTMLIINILQCNVVRNRKGQPLIEFNISGSKVGYLIYNYVQGVVVIRTFLLLTNNDTPEGEKLHDLYGLEKLDKQHMGIDKLSSFALSDIDKNPKVKKVFEDADCQGLFNVSDFIDSKEHNEMHNAAKIAQYLELNEASSVDATQIESELKESSY